MSNLIHKIKNRGWIWLSIFLVMFLLGSFFILSKEQNAYLPYDTHSPSPTGLKAFYTYLTDKIEEVDRWEEKPSLLPEAEHSLLIMAEPYSVPNNETMKDYESFMDKGNTILLMMQNPNSMFDVETETIDRSSIGQITVVKTQQDSNEYRAHVTSPIRLKAEEDDEVLLYDSSGIIALKRPFGKGSLIVSNTPDWLTNEMILQESHLPLVLSFIGNESTFALESVLFDEYIHGEQSGSTLFTTYPQWFLLVMVQGALCTFLLLWKRGKRFGPILIPRTESVRFSDESLRALAAWHIRGKRYQDSLAIQADYVKYDLQERWGISSSMDWVDRAPLLARKLHNRDLKELQTFLLQLTSALKKEKMNRHEYLLWSNRLDELRKEVEEG
ncbi:DUF4350 domain-containing protein [Sutcliffiella deserti]|uniref:DUF4350 domain-containing protein n=1 Tax=Sutcliffiella deserti TaxID=2875501 RepID=UPI001CC128AD|nr:DUF4350 domain-containing protein [Sutcliffiella deserti]